MEDNLEISEREVSNITVYDLSGRIDAATSAKIEGELNKKIESGTVNIIINMKELAYISSSGLRVILAALKRVKTAGGIIALVDLQPGPAEVFKMTGFDRLFPISSTIEEALHHIQT